MAATFMIAVAYLSDWSVKDIMGTMESNDTDMSDYGIFVNADEDEIESGEHQLRQLAEKVKLTKEEKAEKARCIKEPWSCNAIVAWPVHYCTRGSPGCKGPYIR